MYFFLSFNKFKILIYAFKYVMQLIMPPNMEDCKGGLSIYEIYLKIMAEGSTLD